MHVYEMNQVVGCSRSYFPSSSCFCCQNEMMDVKNWRLWIGKPDLSALSGVSPCMDGHLRPCTEPLLAT